MKQGPTHASVAALRPDGHENAARVAISWLEDRHRKGWRNACLGLLDHWRTEDSADIGHLSRDGVIMASINAGEWLLARGEIHARGGLRDINTYLLSNDGPSFTPGQQAWIAQLRERPLRLYRVTDVHPGKGLTLIDELAPLAEPQTVREISGSRDAKPGMLLGARIMHLAPDVGATQGHLELSGAIYPFTKLYEARALDEARLAQDGAIALALHPDNVRDLIELAIARSWLSQWLTPAPLPQIRDASTGDPLMLVTDHYRVQDAAALSAALASQPDVSGDAQQGWNRLAHGDDGLQRSLLAINPGREADHIEVFCRTQRSADEGRAWLEALAGAAVQHLTREIIDPVAHLARRREERTADERHAAPPTTELPPEVLAQAIEQTLHRHYANWCDESIPALGGLTPRQAMATAAGLERVKGLLREYEDGERRQAGLQGRPAVSYRFLWDALGITP